MLPPPEVGQAVPPVSFGHTRFHSFTLDADDVRDEAGVAVDLEIEPPISIHPCLPNVFLFVVLLGA
jgi:hypothetical protein